MNNIPGVLNSLDCGTWNCMVLGGLIPPPSSSSSSESESLAQMAFSAPAGLRAGVRLPFAGVRTLTPGTFFRLAGVPKISECSSGAGIAGEESRSSSIAGWGFVLLLPAAAGVSMLLLLFRAGVRPVR